MARPLDTLLANTLVFLEGQGLVPGSIGIAGGRIAMIGSQGQDMPAAREVIDCQGLWTLPGVIDPHVHFGFGRSEEHTSELQSLMRISYAVFCLKKKNNKKS